MRRRLSPWTVPYRVVERGSGVVFAGVFALGSGVPDVGGLRPRLVVAIATLAALLALAAYETARYRRFAYEVVDDALVIDSGVFARRSREVPLARVQNVDVKRNAVQRLLGVAAVGFETAGGSETEASLQYVSETEADRLRDVVRETREAPGADGPTPETELFALSRSELLLVGALSFDRRVPGFVAFIASGSVPVALGTGMLPTEAAGIAVLVAVVAVAAWVVGAAATIANYHGFRLTRTDSELRYERGLIRRYAGSVPLEKVQTLTVADDPAKRALGYATLVVETAGYAGGEGGEHGSMAAIPLADRDRVWSLARDLEPVGDVDLHRPPSRVRRRYGVRYLLAAGLVAAVVVAVLQVTALSAPRWLPWLAVGLLAIPPAAHLKWRHRGYQLRPDHVVTRNGFWRRRTKVVPYYRVQTVIDRRSLFQRRWNLGTVVVDTAGSLSLLREHAAAVDVDVAVAEDLREGVHDRLQDAIAARRGLAPGRRFQWFGDDDATTSHPSPGSPGAAGTDVDS